MKTEREREEGWNIEKNFRPFRNSVRKFKHSSPSPPRYPILRENLWSDPPRLFQYSPNQSNSIVFNKHANRQDAEVVGTRKIKNVILFLCLRPSSLPPSLPPGRIDHRQRQRARGDRNFSIKMQMLVIRSLTRRKVRHVS